MMAEDPGIKIDEGRHPVLEQLQRDPPFIPNECRLDPESSQIVLLTGPNMGGKSTYLRQNALITLMAHAGSFVPASEARIGLTNVGPMALSANEAAASLVGKSIDESALEEAAQKAMAICEPAEDLRGDVEYKTHMAGEMTRRAIRQAVQRAMGN